MTQETAKKAAGEKAALLIQPGMRVGLGTGSTAKYFIEALAKRIHHEKLPIMCTATSLETERLAEYYGLSCLSVNEIDGIDIDVDGADQIDDNKNMIKGGGGALFREKVIAKASKEMIVLIDPSKKVKQLGGIPLPLEIIPFGHHFTISCLNKMGITGTLRKKDDSLFITDNGNYIFDSTLVDTPNEKYNALLSTVPGVLETGLFLGYAGRVIMGNNDGSVIIS